MSLPVVGGWGDTSRQDRWWVQPLLVFLGLSAFMLYATWAAFQGRHYTYQNYLSPLYSPELFYSTDLPKSPTNDPADDQDLAAKRHSWFGSKPGWWPAWLIFSPALLILWMPGGFRVTCYYYRGAYYKAFWADPSACAVGEPRQSYWGERFLPLILQNVHRYFLYLALAFLVVLTWDVYQGMWFYDRGGSHFGIGVGTLVMLLNVILLGGYTLGCHSFRHLVGGYKDQLSSVRLQYRAYECVSCLNRRHMWWAWFSLFWVAFTDLYVRMCALGLWYDYHWRIT
jgi:hypothetical protein